MGYYTYYDMTVKNVGTEETFNKIVERLKQLDIIGYALDDGVYNAKSMSALFVSWQSVKWYEHDEDLCAVSEQFPECVFILSGNGENSPVFWRAYYKNGVTETCYADIVYPEPDEYFRS